MVKPRRKRPQPASSYKGLAWDKHENCWRVRVSLMGKQHHLGRHTDENYAAHVYDCAAYILFGEEGAINFGPESALEWLPRLESEDCPGLRAIQEIKRAQCDDRPLRRTPPGSSSGSGGGLLTGNRESIGLGLRPRPLASEQQGTDDSGGDDTGCGRDGDEVGVGSIALAAHASPHPAKRARTPTGAGMGPSGMAAGTNPGGVKLTAGLHSLHSTAGDTVVWATGAAPSGSVPAGQQRKKQTAHRFPRPREDFPPWLSVPKRRVITGPGASRSAQVGTVAALSAAASAAAAAASQFTTNVPMIAAMVPQELTAPTLDGGGPGMIPVEPGGRAGAAVIADSYNICGKLGVEGPPLFQTLPPAAVSATTSFAAAAALPLQHGISDVPKPLPTAGQLEAAAIIKDVMPLSIDARSPTALHAPDGPTIPCGSFSMPARSLAPVNLTVCPPPPPEVPIIGGPGSAPAPAAAEWSGTPAGFQSFGPLPDLCYGGYGGAPACAAGFDLCDEWPALGGSA